LTFEGKWDGEEKVAKNNGILPMDDSVATYGITPAYLRDFEGIKPSLEMMRTMSRDKAAKHWESRWNLHNFGELNDQSIATLLMDWSIRRPSHISQFAAKIIGAPDAERKLYIYRTQTRSNMYVNPTNMNFINVINNEKNKRLLFEKIFDLCVRTLLPQSKGLVRRYAAISYDKFLTQSELESLPAAERKKREKVIQDIVNDQIKKNNPLNIKKIRGVGNTEEKKDNTMLYLALGIGALIYLNRK
jgi:hypothetical protein